MLIIYLFISFYYFPISIELFYAFVKIKYYNVIKLFVKESRVNFSLKFTFFYLFNFCYFLMPIGLSYAPVKIIFYNIIELIFIEVELL